MWNYFNHNQFKITPIEGGAGVAHLGYWQLKLPDGYQEPFYWKNSITFDLTKPISFSELEYKKNIFLYEKECKEMLKEITKYNTDKDSVNINLMNKNKLGIFTLYNSKFTIAREKYLWELTIKHIKEDPLYYAKSRMYHFFRFYVTGVNYKKLYASTPLAEKIKTIYPFFITSLCILLGFLLSTIYLLFSRNARFQNYFPLIAICWYAGVFHLPFAIQARYTLPIHLIILIIVSVLAVRFLHLKYEEK
jgi:hypothetical protein